MYLNSNYPGFSFFFQSMVKLQQVEDARLVAVLDVPVHAILCHRQCWVHRGLTQNCPRAELCCRLKKIHVIVSGFPWKDRNYLSPCKIGGVPRQLSSSSLQGQINRVRPVWLGLRRGTFTCLTSGRQHTVIPLSDDALYSSEMGQQHEQHEDKKINWDNSLCSPDGILDERLKATIASSYTSAVLKLRKRRSPTSQRPGAVTL